MVLTLLTHSPVARLPTRGVCVTAEGAKIEAPQTRCRKECPAAARVGGSAASAQNFSIFIIKKTCFGALCSMNFILNVPARESS